MFAQHIEPAHDVRVRVAAFFIDAVGIVQVLGAVDGEPDQKFVCCEKCAPFVVEQGAVGLECGADALAVGVFLLVFDHLAEVIDTEQGGFATLKGEVYFGARLSGDVVANKGFQALVRHLPLLVVGVELFFLQIEAVLAVQVADRADGLGNDVEGLFRW